MRTFGVRRWIDQAIQRYHYSRRRGCETSGDKEMRDALTLSDYGRLGEPPIVINRLRHTTQVWIRFLGDGPP